MMYSQGIAHHGLFEKSVGFMLTWGIVLVILGCLAISAATFTTYLSILLLGIVLLASGIIIIVDSFSFWWKKWSAFFSHLVIGLLYLLIGVSLVQNPLLASISLTLLLGIFYLIIGMFRVIYALSLDF